MFLYCSCHAQDAAHQSLNRTTDAEGSDDG